MVRFERRRFGGRRFGERVNIPRPVREGEEYDVEINEVGSRGDGIARVKNFVVFVPDTKQGEKAHIKIREVRNRFAIGEKVGAAETEEEVTEEAEKPVEEEAPEEETEETTEEIAEEPMEEEEV